MTENSSSIETSQGSCNFKLPWTPKLGMVIKDGKQWIIFTKINPPIIEYAELNWFKAQVMRFIFWARNVK